jgi:hypothetical protein
MKSSPVATLLVLLLVVSAGLGLARMPKSHPGMGFYPEIAPFTASSAAIQAGEAVTLSWETRGTVSVTIQSTRENGGSEIVEVQKGLPPAGSLTLRPRGTTRWTMWCETVFSGRACLPTEVKVEVKGGVPEKFESVSD